MKNTLTLTELKQEILKFYGYELNELNMNREMIITEIDNCYETPGTVVFSIVGSPPKGIAILLKNDLASESEWKGNLVFIGNGKVSKIKYHIEIKRLPKDQILKKCCSEGILIENDCLDYISQNDLEAKFLQTLESLKNKNEKVMTLQDLRDLK
jgi:hypothetical protein